MKHRKMFPPRPWWWLLASLLLIASVHAGDVKVHAFLDRTQAQLGDTVTLNVEIDGATRAKAPDVDALSSDFEILGRSRSSSINIVNGQRSVKTLWAVQLRPRHAGRIDIPPLQVDGHETAPLTLTVGAAPATASGGPGDPVFLKVKPSTRTPYVGQQVALTVRLFYAPSINSGSLDMPTASDVELRQLGKASRYQVQRGGQFYNVLERHYAVIARHAGSVDLAPVQFRGSMARPGSLADFMGQGHEVDARSQSIHLDVRAKPAGHGKHTWLPARDLSLQLTGWPSDGRIEVGQPLTLTLTEKAVGLPFESLPRLQWPAMQGVEVYPDQAHKQTDDSGRWLVGTRTRKFALVAQHAGQVTVPAITLSWWNVRTGKAEMARIPAHVLHVIATGQTAVTVPPATSGSAASTAPATGASTSPSAKPAAASSPTGPEGHVLAWVALGLWLATVLAVGGFWWWRHRRHATPSDAPVPETAGNPRRRCRQAFFQAVRDNDVAAQCDSLLAWARSEKPSVHHLGELASALQPGVQTEAIVAMQRARYAPGTHGPDAEALLAAFGKGLAWRDDPPASTPGPALPSLYPQ